MKAERRHELQTNTLAKTLADVPLYLRFHFGKILLGLLLGALLVLLIRHRMAAGRVRGLEAINGLTEARRLVSQLPLLDLAEPDLAQRASERKRAASEAEGLLDQLFQETQDPDDSALRAEAYVARGDLFWALANLPPIPGAATQPTLQLPQTADQYLKQSEDAYQQVLRDYRDRTLSALTAMFGLAAVAENRGEYDAAAAQYEAITKHPNVTDISKSLAAQRREYLSRLREPLFTGTVTSQPTTRPDTIAAPQPSTQP